MPKYCMKCGAQNDDQAHFCTKCGAPLPAAGSEAPSGQPVQTFLVVREAGEHKHILSDFVFKDPGGMVSFIVRHTSTLHQNFDIQDGGGATLGKLIHKTGLTQSSVEVYDFVQAMVCVVHFKGRQPGTAFPNSWLEDPRGGRMGDVTFAFPINFQVSKPDGSPLIGASVALEGGILHELQDLGRERFNVQVFDPTLPLWQAAGIFVAVDIGRSMTGRSHPTLGV